MRLLHALLKLHYATARQLCRREFSCPGSLTYVQTQLKSLADAGYIERLFLLRRTRAGSSPNVFTLATPGMQHLAGGGLEVPSRTRRYKERGRSEFFLAHAVEVSELIISAELFCRAHPHIELSRSLHDYDLRRRPTTVLIDNGSASQPIKVTYSPDAYLVLAVADQSEAPLAIEIDRGSEGRTQWQRKVRSIIAFSQGPYQRAFGTQYLTVCVLTTTDHKRLVDLYPWTQAELETLGQTDEADLFRFAAFDLCHTEPKEIFLAPRWYSLESDSAMPLLDVPDA
jgi:hypothetical protein